MSSVRPGRGRWRWGTVAETCVHSFCMVQQFSRCRKMEEHMMMLVFETKKKKRWKSMTQEKMEGRQSIQCCRRWSAVGVVSVTVGCHKHKHIFMHFGVAKSGYFQSNVCVDWLSIVIVAVNNNSSSSSNIVLLLFVVVVWLFTFTCKYAIGKENRILYNSRL